MKQKAFKSMSQLVWSSTMVLCMVAALTFLSSSPAEANSNRTTCNIQAGYKIYYILRNGKLGKRDYTIGSTQSRTYTCIKDRYYHRILINGKWRYVSVEAEARAPVQQTNVDEPHPTTEEAVVEDDNVNGDAPSLSQRGSLTNQLGLRANYNIRNNNGARIGSTFGIDSSKQSVQVKLSAPNTPIVNADGLVNVQYNYINSRGRSESVNAWVSPEAIINYDQVIRPPSASGGSVYVGSDHTTAPSPAASSGNTTAGGTPAGNADISGSSASASDEQTASDFNIDNPNIPEAGEQINILRGIEALIPKTQPFLASEPMDGVKPLNSGSELIATGNRECDKDSKKCFVEVEFSDDTDGEFVGWIDEQQTTVNPTYHLAGGQNGNLSGGGQNADSDELATAEGESASENWYQLRFTEEERAAHERLFEIVRNMPPQISYATNRGLIRLHNDRRGFCGSYHYATEDNPRVGASDEIQTYAKPLTACVLARLTQTWKKYHCPDGGNNNGCRLSTGDISHRTLRRFDGHRSHTDGECVDIRPIRKSGVGPLDYNSGSYDRTKTRELIKVLKDLGGTNIFFNDPVLRKEGLSSYAGGHHNHIHVCFKSGTTKAKNSCSSYAPDYETCPELRSLFNAPLMQQFKK